MATDTLNIISGTSAASGIVALELAECHEMLAQQRLCLLCTTDGGQPYAIPMFYGFDAGTKQLYLGISEGRKTRILDENPLLTLAVTEVGQGDAWRSVLVAGRATWITEGPERTAAVQTLMAHNRRPERQVPASPDGTGQPAPPPRRHGSGRIMRVDDAVITGRAKR